MTHHAAAPAVASDVADTAPRGVDLRVVRPDPTATLRRLLTAAAVLPPGARRWVSLTVEARDALADLIARGIVPDHLAIGPDEPPAVVSRTLAAAWRRVGGSPLSDRDHAVAVPAPQRRLLA